MEQGYLAQVQALIDQKWKENPEEMKRVMEDIEAKEKANKEKPKVEAPKVVSFDPQLLTQELIEEMSKFLIHTDISKVQDLIERGADVNAKDNHGMTPLHWASWKYCIIIIAELFLDAGADVDAKDVIGQTPLHLASIRNHIEIAKLLIKRGADLMAKDKYGATPLDSAQLDEMRELLKKYMK
jgi:ankyrin repeat protein